VVPAGKRRFLGLGRGYLIYGPEELFTLPGRNRAVDLTTGLWGIFMPGLMQLITGTYLFVGLTWFDSFREKPLYMAARAFGGDPRPNGFMSVAFALVSVLGVIVFFKTSDAPVGGPFIGLTCINVSDFFASLFRHAPRDRPGHRCTRLAEPTALGELGERPPPILSQAPARRRLHRAGGEAEATRHELRLRIVAPLDPELAVFGRAAVIAAERGLAARIHSS
jgi:hypothetical protein